MMKITKEKIFEAGSIKGCLYDGGFWIRIKGYGISVIDKIKYPPMFSERNKHRKVYRIRRLGIEYLQPLKTSN